MVKQLYYSEIHLKNIKIYLSKLYIGMYYEVHACNNIHVKKHRHLLTAGALLIISCVQVAVL